jgi:penicillin-insensitive murein endopeptidase
VIFDPRLTVLLLKTRHGPELAASLPFMKQRPWIRHDEHYQVDFAIACKPLAAFGREQF